MTMNSRRTLHALTFVMLLNILLWGLFFIQQGNAFYMDESLHLDQIERFASLNFTLNPLLAMLPGYHVVLGAFAFVLNLKDIQSIRLLAVSANILFIFVLMLVLNIVDKENANLKTIQAFFTAIVFPFLYLIYTDILSTAFLLLALYFSKKKRIVFSGFAAAVSVLMRQINIVWILFIHTLYVYEEIRDGKSMKDALLSSWPYIICYALLLLIYVLNPSLVINDSGKSLSALSAGHVSINNVIFFLIVFGFVFLPEIFRTVLKMDRNILLVYVVTSIYLLFFYMNGIRYDYSFNQTSSLYNTSLQRYVPVLHNYLLMVFQNNIPMTFSVTAYPLISLIILEFINPVYGMLYAFSLVQFLFILQVDIRYFIVPILLIQIFRKPSLKTVEYLILFWNVGFSLLFLYLVRNGLVHL